MLTDDLGRTSYDRKEPYTNLITWVYDGGSYTPVAKLTEDDSYHANNNALNGKGFGLSGVDKQGNTIVLHHYKQNPNGDLIAMPAKHHDKPHTNPGQHPFGKQKGTGLTPDERAAFNKWKQEYWKSQAEAELKARGKKTGCH